MSGAVCLMGLVLCFSLQATVVGRIAGAVAGLEPGWNRCGLTVRPQRSAAQSGS